jgi:hypothetical protein
MDAHSWFADVVKVVDLLFDLRTHHDAVLVATCYKFLQHFLGAVLLHVDVVGRESLYVVHELLQGQLPGHFLLALLYLLEHLFKGVVRGLVLQPQVVSVEPEVRLQALVQFFIVGKALLVELAVVGAVGDAERVVPQDEEQAAGS